MGNQQPLFTVRTNCHMLRIAQKLQQPLKSDAVNSMEKSPYVFYTLLLSLQSLAVKCVGCADVTGLWKGGAVHPLQPRGFLL